MAAPAGSHNGRPEPTRGSVAKTRRSLFSSRWSRLLVFWSIIVPLLARSRPASEPEPAVGTTTAPGSLRGRWIYAMSGQRDGAGVLRRRRDLTHTHGQSVEHPHQNR